MIVSLFRILYHYILATAHFLPNNFSLLHYQFLIKRFIFTCMPVPAMEHQPGTDHCIQVLK